jgi:hypothetical protein
MRNTDTSTITDILATGAPGVNAPAGPHRRSADFDWVMAVGGLVIALAGMLVRPALPYQVDTGIGLAVLVASASASVWLAQRLFVWRRQRRRPRGTRRAIAIAVVLAFVLLAAARPHPTSYHRAQCTFGIFGLGVGTVWVKLDPEPTQVGRKYDLRITWGPFEARAVERLVGTTYFTFNKRDFRSPGADVVSEPAANLTCGNGDPPPGSTQIALTPDLWHR